MLTAKQREARKAGIGGSDVAAIMGISPWKTANEVYLEKRGEIEPENIDDKELIIFGNLLEDVVADYFATRNDCKVQKRNEMIVHKQHPFLMANIDRKIVGKPSVLEIKTADKYSVGKWGEDGTEEIPDYYRTQIEHYFNVTGYPEGVVAVLIGGNHYRQYPIQQNLELSEMLMEGCVKFWEQVKKGVPPAIDFDHQSTAGMIKRLYPGTNGETIILPDDFLHWQLVKKEAENEVKQYQSVVDACKNRIASAMGDNAIGIIPGAAFQYKRGQVKASTFTVEKAAYMVMRGSKYTPPKEAAE